MDNLSPEAPRVAAKLRTFMRFAIDLGGLSTCQRGPVGALITDAEFSEVYSIGYNGPCVGLDDCSGVEGDCGCVHAEANAITKLRVPTHGLILLSTTAPCKSCAGLIVNRRQIAAVIWRQPYRNNLGLDKLHKAGILEMPDAEAIEWWVTYRTRWRAARSAW